MSETSPTKNISPKIKRWKKWVLWSAIASGILFVLGTLWIRFYLDPYLQTWLIRQVEKGSEGKYKLEIQDLNFRIWQMSLEVNGVHLYSLKPRQSEGLNLDLKVKQLHIKQVHWWHYWQTQKIVVESVELHEPTIDLYNPKVQKTLKIKEIPAQLQKFVASFTPELTLKKVAFQRAKCLIQANVPTGKVFHQFASLDLTLAQLKIRTNQQGFDAHQDLSLQNFELMVLNYNTQSADGFYKIHGQTLQASMQDSSITLRYVSLLPRYEDKGRDKIKLNLPYLRSKGVDFFEALHKQIIKIRKVEARQATLHIQTKIAPALLTEQASSPIPFPKDLKTQLHEFPVPVAIDTLLVSKANFSFKQPVAHLTHIGYHKAEEANLAIYRMRIGQYHNPNQEAEAGFDAESGLPFFAKNVSLTVKNFEHESVSGQYRFGIKSMNVSSQDSVLYLEKAYLKPLIPAQEIAQSLAYQSIISTTEVPSLIALKVDFEKMIYRQVFRLGSLHLYAPNYEGFLDATKPKQTGQKFRNFEQMLRSIPLDIQADTLAIHQAKVVYKSLQKTQNKDSIPHVATHSLEKLDLRVQKIDLGRALNESAIEHIDTKKLVIKAKNYSYQNADQSYELKAGSVEASADKHLIEVQNLQLLPTTQNTKIGKITLQIPQMKGEGIDFVLFMLKQQINWDKLTVQGAKIAIERKKDKTEHTKSEKRTDAIEKSLEASLASLPVFVRIDTLQVKQATFILEEKDKEDNITSRHQVENAEGLLLQIALGEATRYEADSIARFWQEQSLAFMLQKYSYEAQDLTYQFTLQNIQKKPQNTRWEIEALAWNSVLDLQKCKERFPDRQWLAEGTLRSISLEVQDLEEIIFRKHIAIQQAIIQEPKLKFWFFETTKKDSITALNAFKAGGFENLPLYLSVDTLLMQNAQIECFNPIFEGKEIKNRWTQTTKLALNIAKLEWDKKLTWRHVDLAGKDYVLKHPQVQANVKEWAITFEKEAPRFQVKGITCKWKSAEAMPDSWAEMAELSAHLPALSVGKLPNFDDLRLSGGKAEIYLSSQKRTQNQSFHFPDLHIDTFSLQNVVFQIHQKTPNQLQTHNFFLDEGVWQAMDFQKTNDFPKIKNFSLKIKDYQTHFRNYLYRASAKSLHWQSKSNELIIKQLKILPTITEKKLNRQQTHQKELYETQIGTLKAQNFDVSAFWEKHEVQAQKLTLDSLDLQISADRRLPTRSRRRRMPAQIMRAMKMPLRIDTIQINHLDLAYQEKVAGAQKVGKLFVKNIHAQVIGLNNRPQSKDSIHLSAAGKLMDLGDANIQVHMALMPDLMARITGNLGKFKADFMNDFLETTRHIQIRKGDIQGAKFWVVMQDSTAIGVLEAGYKHLRLDILSKKKDNKKRGFISFLANIFINNRNNLEKNRHKIGNILYERLPEESFVRFLVRSLAMGILNTLK